MVRQAVDAVALERVGLESCDQQRALQTQQRKTRLRPSDLRRGWKSFLQPRRLPVCASAGPHAAPVPGARAFRAHPAENPSLQET